jgi:hypothetical protein
MTQIRSLIVASAVLLSLGSAQANVITTFGVWGTTYSPSSNRFYGTLTIDVTAGKLAGVDITFRGIERFTQLFGAVPVAGGTAWYVLAHTSDRTAGMHLQFSTQNGTLVGYAGGTIQLFKVTTPHGVLAEGNTGQIGLTCYSEYFSPYCGPLARPYCSRRIPCSSFGRQASICAEWRCIVRPEIQRRRSVERR